MWELIDGWYVNSDNPQERLTPEQYRYYEAQQQQPAFNPLQTQQPEQPQHKAKLPSGIGTILSAIGSYYAGPIGAAAGKKIGNAISEGDTSKLSKVSVSDLQSLGKSAIASYVSADVGGDAGAFEGYNKAPELSEYAQQYSVANNPPDTSAVDTISQFVRNKIAGASHGLIGGDYQPNIQTESAVANFGEGLKSSGLDTLAANAKEGNIASALGNATTFTLNNYKPPIRRRRYY